MKRLPRKKKKTELTQEIKSLFKFGYADTFGYFYQSVFTTEEEQAAEHDRLWKLFGKKYLPEYIKKFPGQRPDAWWRNDAPSPGRPIVPPWDGISRPHDYSDREHAGLKFLIQHHLLGKQEEEAIAARETKLQRLSSDPRLGVLEEK